jgi:hypothetical protein
VRATSPPTFPVIPVMAYMIDSLAEAIKSNLALTMVQYDTYRIVMKSSRVFELLTRGHE